MTVMVDERTSIPELLDGIDAPEGWRVEYVEGGIVVSPPPGPFHESILTNLLYQLIPTVKFVRQAGRGYCMRRNCADRTVGDHVIPDLAIGTRDFTPAEMEDAQHTHGGWLPADSLDVVFEVTSSNRKTDTRDKYAAYGRMGVPHYVLVDRAKHTVIVYSDPSGPAPQPGYATTQSFPFGQDVHLPAPYPALRTTTWS